MTLFRWPFPRPRLSVVLIVYRMAEQAERSLLSLSCVYQSGVRESDYEIIVVENESDSMLGAQRARQHGKNVRYYARAETQRTPVHAVNLGASLARGSHVAIMIDGARMLTPGVLRLTLDAFRIARHAAVAVPGYHLGHKLQQVSVLEGYDELAEKQLLESIDWPADGYRLHDIAVLSGSCRDGFLLPIGESNFLATSAERWQALGGMDARYDDFGGGYANIDLYKRLVETPQTPLYLLFAEGTFHQYHGGVTTGAAGHDNEQLARRLVEQDAALRGPDRAPPLAQPVLFGAPRPGCHRFLRHSLDQTSGI